VGDQINATGGTISTKPGDTLIAREVKKSASVLVLRHSKGFPAWSGGRGSLLESEFFGFEKGAFTDAQDAKEGLPETAHGGTLLLDEVGETPLTLQAKLLGILADHTFRFPCTESRLVSRVVQRTPPGQTLRCR